MSRLHPLAAALAHRFVDGHFSAASLDALEVGLRALGPTPALGHAVESLVALAAHVERDLGLVGPARAIVARVARVDDLLRELILRARDQGEASVEAKVVALRRFADRQEVRRAPRLDAPTPDGAVLARTLAPRRAIR
jgi:hypothetical protein